MLSFLNYPLSKNEITVPNLTNPEISKNEIESFVKHSRGSFINKQHAEVFKADTILF